MNNKRFATIPLRYASSDEKTKIYRQILAKEKAYFTDQDKSKKADRLFWIKTATFSILFIVFYTLMLSTSSEALFVINAVMLGIALLLLGINTGHDAAHHAVTGNAKIDNFIFRAAFVIQGLSGYLWQIRHNYSHHVFPNVYEQDSDMNMGGVIVLDPNEDIKWFHKYQHIYATFIYFFGSLVLMFFLDLKMMLSKEHGNLRMGRIPASEWVIFLVSKLFQISVFIAIPYMFTDFSIVTILIGYFAMHMVLSIFMMFTFVISHHVREVSHIDHISSGVIDDSWVRHQIMSAIDFNVDSMFSNFIFGGFNLHIAHHVFPGVCHTHYPALTAIIKDVLAENDCQEWYQSYSFMDGCKSHLLYLRDVGTGSLEPTIIPLFAKN